MLLTSQTITDDTPSVNPVSFRFELATGNEGIKTIVEPLLDTEAKALERANREFLNEGYIHKFITLSTYRSDLNIGDIILVYGLKYKILTINIISDTSKMIFSIRGERYE